VAVSLKRVKIEEKLPWRAYRNSPTLFRTASSPTPYGLLFPNFGGSQPLPKTPIGIILGTGEAADFKFGRYIHRVHPNKSPLKFRRKGSVGVSRDCQFLGVPPVISGTSTATDFKFSRYIRRVHPNKSPLNILEKREGGRIQGLSNIFKYPYYLRNW